MATRISTDKIILMEAKNYDKDTPCKRCNTVGIEQTIWHRKHTPEMIMVSWDCRECGMNHEFPFAKIEKDEQGIAWEGEI